MITEEDFSAWRDNSITQAVFRALMLKAAEAKARWLTNSWDQGQPDPLLLADLRARAQIAEDITELTHEELESILESEPS